MKGGQHSWKQLAEPSEVLLKQDGVARPMYPTSVPWDAPSRGSGGPNHITRVTCSILEAEGDLKIS